MVKLTRKAREQHRHDRAVVIQQITTATLAEQIADQKAEKRRGDELRRKALRRIQ